MLQWPTENLCEGPSETCVNNSSICTHSVFYKMVFLEIGNYFGKVVKLVFFSQSAVLDCYLLVDFFNILYVYCIDTHNLK